MRLAEETRITEGDSLLAILYDQMQRQQWAKRAAQRDPALDIAAEASKVNEQVLLAARTRLELIGQHFQPKDNGRGRGPVGAATSNPYQLSAADSSLAKSARAAQAITKRAEQAAKAFAQHQEDFNKKQQSGKGYGKKWNARDDRRQNWMDINGARASDWKRGRWGRG